MCGPDDDVLLPPESARVDGEAEPAVVIGSVTHQVPAERALDHVAGYTVCKDVSAREPSGFRVELNTGGYRNYVPDWTPQVWRPSTGSASIYRNGAMPMSMTESFPPDPGHPTATEEGVLQGTEDALLNPYAVPGRG